MALIIEKYLEINIDRAVAQHQMVETRKAGKSFEVVHQALLAIVSNLK